MVILVYPALIKSAQLVRKIRWFLAFVSGRSESALV
jgi:hypothetical protein